jgi:hypothetical protein
MEAVSSCSAEHPRLGQQTTTTVDAAGIFQPPVRGTSLKQKEQTVDLKRFAKLME